MKSIRYWLIYLRAHLIRYNKILAVLAVLVLIIGFSVFNLVSQLTSRHVSEGIIGTYTEDDLPPIVTSLISRPLISIDKNLSPVPDLAESIVASDSAKVYTVKLRPDIFFSDGSRITSKDIDFNKPGMELSRIDETTIIFKLADSFSPFPSLLVKPVLKNNRIGTGPYKISSMVKDSRSGVFINKLDLEPINSNLPRVSFKFYANEKIAKSALRLGEVSSLINVADTTDLTRDNVFSTLTKDNYSKLVTIFYNTKDPVLSDENFRVALSYAAPSFDSENVAQTSIPKISEYFNPDTKKYLNNPTEAKKALDKVKSGADSTITLTATTSLKKVGEKVVEAWNNAGIKAVLRVESGIPQNFQALLISQTIPSDPDQYTLWHATQKNTNISQISMARLDKDLEDGRKIDDQEKRKTAYADFQKVLNDHAPATFLYFPKTSVVYLKKAEPELTKVLNLQLLNY